ncbi:hypothetical protein FOA43_003848 [Brettanomyces nanus]|uniref:Uncharacterized protein n=1 Tax=Eeniella nana TaxID=13502 RepID=A0A875SA40_EENNA|nr:uncharacterized protein FOA43_003848 [Brettanomyces nanus]QPG76459.1 hypothetical protein FOA43_003848 [Brettanomyces nanus]
MPEFIPPVSGINANLLDLKTIRQSALDELIDIFASISVPVSESSSSGHLLLLDESLSSRINSLTSFSRLRESTGISKVIWLDYKDTHHYDYSFLTGQFHSFVVMLDLVSLDDLIGLAHFLKEKMTIFNQGNLAVSVIFVDSNKQQCSQFLLETQGVWGDLQNVYHWTLGKLNVIDDDILTLDLKHGGLDKLLKYESIEPIESLAKALLQMVIKSNYKIRITNIYLKGDWSVKFWKIYQRLYNEHLAHLPANITKLIDDQDETLFSDQFSFFNRNVDLVCLDRGVDIMSCLMTQLSYTGLCDEVLGTALGILKYKEDDKELNKNGHAEADDVDKGLTTVVLGDPTDEIYPSIRDLNISMVGSVLNARAKQLQSDYDKRKSLKDIDEIKQFMGGLNQLKTLQTWVQRHTSLAERIVSTLKPVQPGSQVDSLLAEDDLVDTPSYGYYNEFIELQQDIIADNFDSKNNCTKILDILYKYEPSIEDIMKLLIMTSIVKKGVRESEYNTLKNSILNMYGIQYMPLFIKLRELKFFYPREAQLNFLSTTAPDDRDFGKYQLIKDFASVANSMNLLPIVKDQNLLNPAEADFALPGYVPLITRLVQAVYDRGFTKGAASGRHAQPQQQQDRQSLTRYKKYGWDNLSMSDLNGEVYQDLLVPESKRSLFSTLIPPKMSQLKNYYSQRKDMIIVSVIGGLTYSEIATLRYVLSKNEVTRSKQVVILVTGIIKGDDLVDALM